MGGKREGAGRPAGSKDGPRIARQRLMEEVTRTLGTKDIVIDGVPIALFEGDALDLLRAVYRDPRVGLDLRIDAAKTAIRYERPSIAAVEIDAGKEKVFRITLMIGDAEL